MLTSRLIFDALKDLDGAHQRFSRTISKTLAAFERRNLDPHYTQLQKLLFDLQSVCNQQESLEAVACGQLQPSHLPITQDLCRDRVISIALLQRRLMPVIQFSKSALVEVKKCLLEAKKLRQEAQDNLVFNWVGGQKIFEQIERHGNWQTKYVSQSGLCVIDQRAATARAPALFEFFLESEVYSGQDHEYSQLDFVDTLTGETMSDLKLEAFGIFSENKHSDFHAFTFVRSIDTHSLHRTLRPVIKDVLLENFHQNYSKV